MYYYLIIALQVYCAYHCYTNRNNYYWYFAIIFLPLIGCLAYLFINVVRASEVNAVQDTIISAINPSKKITELEKKFRFSETFENQVALADAYLEAGHYDKSIEHYEASLKDVFQNDFYTLAQLTEAYYCSSRFNEAVACAEKIREFPKFKKSRAAFLYALAMEKIGHTEEAENFLEGFNAPYSRYQERLELSKFYIRHTKMKEAKVILQEIVFESERMSKSSFRQNRQLIQRAKELLTTL